MADETRPLNERVYANYIRPFVDDYVTPTIDASARYVPPELRSKISLLAQLLAAPDTIGPVGRAREAVEGGRYGEAAVEGLNAAIAPFLATPLTAELLAGRLAGRAGAVKEGLTKGGGDPISSRGSKHVAYNPPSVKPRAWEDDYGRVSPGYEPSGPLRSPEGTIIDAPFVAGRRRHGGPNEGLLPEESSELSRLLAGTVPEGVARSSIPKKAAGALQKTQGPDGFQYRILFDKSLSPPQGQRIISHEVGHLLDEMAGQVKLPVRETRKVYSDLYTAQPWRKRGLTGPEHLGYEEHEVPRELAAEAIRAYMANPDYLKTVAPKTAEIIRRWFNDHPVIAKVLQFNAAALSLSPFVKDDRK